MGQRERLFARLGIVGAWTALVSGLLLYLAVLIVGRVSAADEGPGAVVSLSGFLLGWLGTVSDAGAVGVGVGLLLLVVGWVRLVTLVP
jgi:hypothetical protein